MGAWGHKAFENDSALDWFSELAGVEDLRHILAAVAETDSDEYLDVDDGSAAIAAAELVAATRVDGADRLNKGARAWVAANAGEIDDDDVAVARSAVLRVLGPASELKDLWAEGGADNAWLADVRVLLTRLGDETSADPSAADASPLSDSNLVLWKQLVLGTLADRGLPISAAQRRRISSSRNSAEVRRWLAGATDATSVETLLDG